MQKLNFDISLALGILENLLKHLKELRSEESFEKMIIDSTVGTCNGNWSRLFLRTYGVKLNHDVFANNLIMNTMMNQLLTQNSNSKYIFITLHLI